MKLKFIQKWLYMIFFSNSLQLQIIQLSHCDKLVGCWSKAQGRSLRLDHLERRKEPPCLKWILKRLKDVTPGRRETKQKERGRCWTDWTEIFFLKWISKYFCGCNWFDLLAMDSPNKNSRVFSNEFSWLHCTYQFDGQLKTLRAVGHWTQWLDGRT